MKERGRRRETVTGEFSSSAAAGTTTTIAFDKKEKKKLCDFLFLLLPPIPRWNRNQSPSIFTGIITTTIMQVKPGGKEGK